MGVGVGVGMAASCEMNEMRLIFRRENVCATRAGVHTHANHSHKWHPSTSCVRARIEVVHADQVRDAFPGFD